MKDSWAELKEYLEGKGLEFSPAQMTGRDKMVEDEFAGYKSTIQFYKRNWSYLYHLTAFDLDQWKVPYFQLLFEQIRPCQVLDYGCGIGADGLRLARHGFDPAFADYKSRCTDYLKWRIKRRKAKWPVYDIEKAVIPRHDLVVSFDVIEHVGMKVKQAAFVTRLAELGRTVIFNMPSGLPRSPLHNPVDVEAVLESIESVGSVRLHRVVNAFQHVVIFDTPEVESNPEPGIAVEEDQNGSD